MSKHFLVAISFFLVRFVNAQNIQLEIHSGKLADFEKVEETLGSKKEKNQSNYISESGVAQPEIYRRRQEGLPDLIVYYYYYEKDSTIQYILYEWDISNVPGHTENTKLSNAEVVRFIQKYNDLHAQIAARYGRSETDGSLTDTSLIENGLSRRDIWKPDDTTEIEMYTALSSKYVKNGAVTINPTYHTRLFIRNIKASRQPALPELNDERVRILDSVAHGFFLAMKSKDFGKARGYIASSISKFVTDEQLGQLFQSFRFDENFDIFFKGIQMGLDGSSFYVLQYKYTSDTGTPPKEMLKVVFDSSDEIKAVFPLKRNQ